jgi:tetratricopeptide (TPR) repeat protein
MTPEQAVKTLQDAIVSHQKGDIEAAESLYDRVIENQPRLPDAWHMKAQIELGREHYKEAVSLIEKALELHSETPVYWTTLGNAHLQNQNYPEADKAFSTALEKDGSYVQAVQGLGISAQEQVKDTEAIDYLSKALTLDENLPFALTHRAIVRLRRGQDATAELDLQKALSIFPGFMMARLYMGLVLNNKRQASEALRYFTDLYNEGYRVPHLYNAYSSVQLQLGHNKQAAALVEEGVRAFPNDMGLHYQRSRIKKVMEDDMYFPNVQEAFQSLLESNPNKYKAGYVLTAVYENSKNYEKSLDVLIQTNALKREFLHYNEKTIQAHVEAMKSFFTQENIQMLKGAGLSTEKPVFILGMPRSGTTLVEQILSTGEYIFGAGELNHLQNTLGIKNERNIYRNFHEWAEPVTAPKIKIWAQEYLSLMSAEDASGEARFISDKMPSNALFVGFIRLMFPKAKIIHCVRNGMDTCLSCFQKNFTHDQGFSYNLGELGRYYNMHEELMAFWHETFDDIHTVKYEDMVADQEATSKSLFAYVGLTWTQEALEFHKSTRSIHTASTNQVRQPIYTGSVDKWRRYGDELKPLAGILGEKLD